MRRLVLLLILVVTAGCASTTAYSPTRTAPLELDPSVESIEMFNTGGVRSGR